MRIPPTELRSCCGRRDFIKVGALGLGGVTLGTLLREEKLLGAPAKDMNCIVLFQLGGNSQVDTFDPKPEAPSEVRGSFKAIRTAVPGVYFSELLPQSAARLKKFAVIRSMHGDDAIHESAQQYVISGTKRRNDLVHPAFGSVAAHEWGPKNGLPPYVAVPNMSRSGGAGFLGSLYDPFNSGDPSAKTFSVKDLTLPLGMKLEQAQARRELLGALDARFRAAEQSGLLERMDEFYQKAFDLVSSPAAKKAFDIAQESEKLRDAYGRTGVGQGALLGRRLVEAGVRVVTVFHGGYDTHTENEPGMKKVNTQFDQAFAALLDDLEARGMLQKTLVLVLTEFGRTPRINNFAGRDHWPRSFSVALAGARTSGGVVIGSTTPTASDPKDRPVSVEDLAFTTYKILGIDPEKEFRANGRPIKFANNGDLISELFT
jgi:hypothetical protein